MSARKRCAHCKEAKPLNQFYRNRSTKDGHLTICKECHLADCQARYRRNRPKHQTLCRTWNERHPQAAAAIKQVGRAIKAGKLIPQPCELCGAENLVPFRRDWRFPEIPCGTFVPAVRRIIAHHDDYSKPLRVRWLCRSCHIQHHTQLAMSMQR